MLSEDVFSYIEHHYSKNLPFVIYKKPGDSIVKSLLQNTSEVYTTEDFKASGFIFAPFEASMQTVFMPLEKSETLSCEVEISHETNVISNRIDTNSAGKNAHIKLVQQGIDTIHQNHLQKVVLSRCESITIPEPLPISIFKNLLDNYPNAFVYCWFHPKIGLWLGATPETLVSVKGNRLKTLALAGTQPYKATLDVVWENKEKEEQQFVTDYIKGRLETSVNNLIVSDAKTVQAGHLLHLQSNISGLLNTDLHTVLNKLHPTPAVCGLPVDEAKDFILENESYNREYYTGFLGELNLKGTTSRNKNRRNIENNAYSSVQTMSHLFVNLRCMQIINNEALIYIGGGITKDSAPQKEWEETVSKAQIMKGVLTL